MGPKPNSEIIPPPTFTHHPIPFNWSYHQNPNSRIMTDLATGARTLVNGSNAMRIQTLFIQGSQPMPSPREMPPIEDEIMSNLISELQRLLNQRPVWTRRAIINQIKDFPGIWLIKPALQYVGYQFRTGPFRDAFIKFGVDPRTDPKYRIYQTLAFQIHGSSEKNAGGLLLGKHEFSRNHDGQPQLKDSHIFDGTSFAYDGKIWQVCDITDPLLKRLLSTETLRETCHNQSDGWYWNGTWAKVKLIMKAKIKAIEAGTHIPDENYEVTLNVPDILTTKSSHVPEPRVPGVAPKSRRRRRPVNQEPLDTWAQQHKSVQKRYKGPGSYASLPSDSISRQGSVSQTPEIPDARIEQAMKSLRNMGIGPLGTIGEDDSQAEDYAEDDDEEGEETEEEAEEEAEEEGGLDDDDDDDIARADEGDAGMAGEEDEDSDTIMAIG